MKSFIKFVITRYAITRFTINNCNGRVFKKIESNVAPTFDVSTIIFKIQSSLNVKVVKRVEILNIVK